MRPWNLSPDNCIVSVKVSTIVSWLLLICSHLRHANRPLYDVQIISIHRTLIGWPIHSITHIWMLCNLALIEARLKRVVFLIDTVPMSQQLQSDQGMTYDNNACNLDRSHPHVHNFYHFYRFHLTSSVHQLLVQTSSTESRSKARCSGQNCARAP